VKALRLTPLVLLLAVPASAEPNFKASLFRQSLAAGADWASTEYAIAHGAREANPVMQGPAGKRAVLKGAQATVAAWGEYELEKRGKKGWAKVVRWGVPAINVLVAAHNMRVAK
jgi:hypothetical protein